MTTSLQHQPSVESEQREPPFSPTLVEGWAQTLGKAVRAHQLYLPNNPVYQRAIEQLPGLLVGSVVDRQDAEARVGLVRK